MLNMLHNKLGIYCSILLCHLWLNTCAYGATALSAPPDQKIQLPAGFELNIYAKLEPLGLPRMMKFDTKGNLYVALANTDKVIMLADTNHDGVADTTQVVAEHLNAPNSVELIGNDLLLIANQDSIVKLSRQGQQWSSPQPLIDHLPSGGHTLKTIKLGADGFLYVNVGSSCNVCREDNPLRASILRFTQEGKPAGYLTTVGRHAPTPIWAEGLRNSQGFAWHPTTGAFFATNEGADNRSDTLNGKVNDELPPEHLNIIQGGKHYGWPYCWGIPTKQDQLFQDPNFIGADHFCDHATAPAITFTSHATPIGITFLNASNFPKEYLSDAIVALHGSWNRKTPSGYRLVRVKFKDNQPIEVVDFATGWLSDSQAWGRPVDVTIGTTDGALYVSDDKSGYIYRIRYTGKHF
jgi:glucose/arabinose dehydrogenase